MSLMGLNLGKYVLLVIELGFSFYIQPYSML